MTSPVLTLTTDFGQADPYLAIMKGTILSIHPQVQLVDISHEIEPQDVAQAAFVIGTSYRYFPKGTVHLIVVDPGVGSHRRPIALATPEAYFVAPDNGLLSYILAEAGANPPPGAQAWAGERMPSLYLWALPQPLQAITLNNPRFWRQPLSATFHGRDIFAPVAAHLSKGTPLNELGEPIPSLLAFPPPRPEVMPDGSLLGHIVHVDHFGNLISDVTEDDLKSTKLTVEAGERHIEGLSRSYSEGGELLAIIGSSGRLEIAASNGSAAQALQLGKGDTIIVRTRKSY